MATWITHLMIADGVLEHIPNLDRQGFCVGNIAPDCNVEAEYLNDHPNSGYLTQILPLKSFPDYIDYLPKGSIVRKIGVMGYLPEVDKSMNKFISMSQDEYADFVKDTVQLVVKQFAEKNLM